MSQEQEQKKKKEEFEKVVFVGRSDEEREKVLLKDVRDCGLYNEKTKTFKEWQEPFK